MNELNMVVSKLVSVYFVISNNETEAIGSNNVGKTKKNPNDEHDERVAMIISLARMLEISEDRILKMVDVLFGNDIRRLEDFTYKELLGELLERVKEDLK